MAAKAHIKFKGDIAPRVLHLSVKKEYFDQIKSGEKKEEYRLFNEFWKKRLFRRQYDLVEIALGYPKRGDYTRRMVFRWNEYLVTQITHKHFGNLPVFVFAINLSERVK